MTSTNTCVICDRPTPDGYACVACAVERPRQLLAEIQDMLPAATDVAHRQARHGTGGGTSGKPGSAILIDLGATARLDGVRTALTTWARHVAEERGVTVPTGTQDPIHVAARWMAAHCEWMRHRAEVDEWLRDVEACARIVRGIARGPADRVYLGPCGASLEICPHCGCAAGWHVGGKCRNGQSEPHACGLAGDVCDWSATCDGDVYGLPDGDTGRCRTCGAEVDQRERRAWLDNEVRQRAYRASELEHAYGLTSATVRKWAERKLLTAHGSDGQGRPLYLLGEVLDVAASEAARREAARVKRERRRTAQAAGMGA
jgi:hypothetical protein